MHTPIRFTLLALALAPLIALPGCATQQELADLKADHGARLGRIEGGLRETAQAAQAARDQAADAHTRAADALARADAATTQAADAKALASEARAQAADAQARAAHAQTRATDALARTYGVETPASEIPPSAAPAPAAPAVTSVAQPAGAGSNPAAGAERVEQRIQVLEQDLARLTALTQDAQAQARAADTLARNALEQALSAYRKGDELQAQLDGTTAIAKDARHEAGLCEHRNQGELVEEVTLIHDTILYPFNAADLDPRDTALLDQLAARLKALPHDYHVEIQGHTDNSSYAEYDLLLGEGRANAVRRYLHIEGGIPLHRMSVISYAASRPLAGNAGLANGNRRLAILVTR